MDTKSVWRSPWIPKDRKAPVGLCYTEQIGIEEAYEKNIFESSQLAMILGKSPMFTHILTLMHMPL